MNRILIIPVIALICLVSFSSCKKNYTCSCIIKTVLKDDGKVVDNSSARYTIRENEDNAKAACKYYELEVKHLERRAIEQHFCSIEGTE
ncbi:MAG: hypothetical protein R2800_01730 [Flavipsychrobacter sp.]